MDVWEVKFTSEYKEWLRQQSDSDKIVIAGRMFLLGEYGPNLARPYADTLKGSKIKNLKELRAKTDTHVFRIAFLFDEAQKAIVLIGGDKKGKDEKRFYKNLIRESLKTSVFRDLPLKKAFAQSLDEQMQGHRKTNRVFRGAHKTG